jgi:murein DD-endopeptidase MepM/ murein hydrolase activator NlpD
MSETPANLPELKKTENIYGLPVPEGTKIQRLVYESASHSGPTQGAIDIAVDLDTPILAPLKGTVIQIVDTNDQQGPTADFAKFNNFIFIEHDNGEISKFSHMPTNSIQELKLKVGDKVKEGDQIARCGFVGATTKPHIHWVVYVKNAENKLES